MKFYTMTQDTNKSLMKVIFSPTSAMPSHVFCCFISLTGPDPLNQWIAEPWDSTLAASQNHLNQKDMYPYVHCSIIYNSQDMEATQVPINRWIDKEESVHIYSGIWLSHQKEWNLVICNYMDGPRGYCAKWIKSQKAKCHMISFICGMLKNKTNSEIQRTN